MNESADYMSLYEGNGITFRYPGYWELTEEDQEGDIVLNVAADDSCFWLLRIFPDCPRPDEVIRSCIQALEEDSEGMEVQKIQGKLAEMPADCRELSFSCLELLNTAVFRCVRTMQATLLVWWQCTDHESEDVRPVFEQMTQSVRILALDNE